MSSLIKRTALHSSSYLIVQIASKFLGLISFPIVTRLLSVGDYGLLALVNTTLLFLFALGKCGISSAVVALHVREEVEGDIYWNGMVSVLISTLLVLCVYVVVVCLLGYKEEIPLVFYLLPPILLGRNLFAVHQAYLRAIGKINHHNIIDFSFEGGSTIVGLFAISLVFPSVSSLFGARLVFEVFFVILLFFFFKNKSERDTNAPIFNSSCIRELLRFGAPLVWLELSMIVMSFGDRFQIAYFVDNEAVGLYSAPYSLAQYARQIIAQPLMLAIYPIYNRLYIEKGRAETTKFLSIILKYYFAVAIPVLIFISFYGANILTVLATAKYAASANIVQVVLLGNLLNGCLPIVSAGLYANKKTTVIGKVTICCAGVNLLLNWLFISLWGYEGAAYSTLITFSILFVFLKREADGFVKVFVDWLYNLKCFFISFLAILPGFWYFHSSLVDMFVAGVLFVLIYLALLVLTDQNLKKWARNIIHIRSN